MSYFSFINFTVYHISCYNCLAEIHDTEAYLFLKKRVTMGENFGLIAKPLRTPNRARSFFNSVYSKQRVSLLGLSRIFDPRQAKIDSVVENLRPPVLSLKSLSNVLSN